MTSLNKKNSLPIGGLSMQLTEFLSTLHQYQEAVERYLSTCLKQAPIPEPLLKAMEYSLLAGGKRIRPILCLTWAELLGSARKEILNFAAAIELIHTYSLIHDDLPAMDDDHLRRGKPANHIKFGEAYAILAGDGLLTEAFSLMLKTNLPPQRIIRATLCVAEAAGPKGMVGGQVLDILFTGKNDPDLGSLKKMHSMKTGALLEASCKAGAMLAGAGQEDLTRAKEFGTCIGLAFQVVDDILDVTGDEKQLGKPIGSDQGLNKCTYPALVGLGQSKQVAATFIAQAHDWLAPYQGPQVSFLHDLADYLLSRMA